MARPALGFVWLTSVRDLRWRWRRFVIAACAAALVLGLTVVLSGLVEHLDGEVTRTVDALGADEFVVAEGIPGPFTSVAPIPAALADEVRALAGVDAADPLVTLPQTIEQDDPVDAYVIGFQPEGLGAPPVDDGVLPGDGEAVIDEKAGVELGEDVVVGGVTLTVVGTTDGLTVLGERPNVYVTIGTARDAFFDGRAVATSILVAGEVGDGAETLEGVKVLDRAEAVDDLRRPMADTVDSITLFRVLLWIVAAAIVGSVLYLSALERSRDMAVLKATGAGSIDLAAGLVVQAAVLAVAASIAAIGVAEALVPLFPAGISLPLSLLLTVPIVALVVGIAGSLVGLRRVLRVDPAQAFGGP